MRERQREKICPLLYHFDEKTGITFLNMAVERMHGKRLLVDSILPPAVVAIFARARTRRALTKVVL